MPGDPMHFEILVEDSSGKKALEILVPKIIGADHTFRVLSYKGIGRIPKNMKSTEVAANRILLENLPKLLKGYGRTFNAYYSAAVILVCDLDEKCLKAFRRELFDILDQCHTKPQTRFCIAIEEGEAWLLGDLHAVKMAYPNAKNAVLGTYINDSVCETWEKLADAVYPGGSAALCNRDWQTIGSEKSKWAERISVNMDVNNNISPSFCYFRDKLRELAGVMV
jgi:hypothetical protein